MTTTFESNLSKLDYEKSAQLIQQAKKHFAAPNGIYTNKHQLAGPVLYNLSQLWVATWQENGGTKPSYSEGVSRSKVAGTK